MIRQETTDPQYVADYVEAYYSPRRPALWTLVLAINSDGYMVGIADANIAGYTPTHLYISIHNYDKAREVVDEAVKILFPNRHEDVNFEIEMSSMFPKQ